MGEKTSRQLNKIGEFLGLLTTNLGTLVVLLVLGHFLIGALSAVKDLALGDKHYDPRVELPVYEHFERKYDYGREFTEAQTRREFRPHYLWRSRGHGGEFINVSGDGIRKTVKSPRPGAKKVFMFGGSTMWGEGSPDGGTIPSQLQALLGDGYDVYNYGDIGYMTVQEYNYLLDRLSRGERPDIVIFYDGANDGYASVYSPAQPRGIHNLERLLGIRMRESTLADAFLDLYRKSNYQKLEKYVVNPFAAVAAWDAQVEPKIEENARLTLDYYEQFVRQTRALAELYDFDVYFFWQPVLFSGSRKGLDYEQEMVRNASPVWVQSQARLHGLARRRLSGRESEGLYYLGDVFNTLNEPVYIDWCHVGPNGNTVIAREMVRQLKLGAAL